MRSAPRSVRKRDKRNARNNFIYHKKNSGLTPRVGVSYIFRGFQEMSGQPGGGGERGEDGKWKTSAAARRSFLVVVVANDGRTHEHECISVDGIRDAKAVPVVQFIALSALPALGENTSPGRRYTE